MNIEANRSKDFKKTLDAIISRAHNLILTIEQLLNLLNEEFNNCVYSNTSDTNGKLTNNRWWTSDFKNLSNSWYNVNNNLQKDYRETWETGRRRSKIHGQEYFGYYRTQFMGKRKSKKHKPNSKAEYKN